MIISEVMQNPEVVPDFDGEWFELYNTRAFDVDIECMGGVAHPLCDDDILIHELLRNLKRLDLER